jgi:hypothetical protein
VRLISQGEKGHNYEISGDYEFALLDGRLKLIGLKRYFDDLSRNRAYKLFRTVQPTSETASSGTALPKS